MLGKAVPDVIEDTFGNSSRYAQDGSNIQWNNPDPELVGTALIERFNGTCRNGLGLARKCYGFSKRLNMLQSAVDLFVGYYNFCRVHKSLGKTITPAMKAGVTDHIWTIEELLVAGKTEAAA